MTTELTDREVRDALEARERRAKQEREDARARLAREAFDAALPAALASGETSGAVERLRGDVRSARLSKASATSAGTTVRVTFRTRSGARAFSQGGLYPGVQVDVSSTPERVARSLFKAFPTDAVDERIVGQVRAAVLAAHGEELAKKVGTWMLHSRASEELVLADAETALAAEELMRQAEGAIRGVLSSGDDARKRKAHALGRAKKALQESLNAAVAEGLSLDDLEDMFNRAMVETIHKG